MSCSTGFTPSSDSANSPKNVQDLDGTQSLLSTEPIGGLPLDQVKVDFEPEFEWKVDPNWVPGPWDDVAFARNIEKQAQPPPPPVTHNSVSVKQFVCSLCDKSYKRKNDARIHVGEVHLSLYRFFCPYCDHKTSRGWSYDRHLRNVHKIHNRDGKKRAGRPSNGVNKATTSGSRAPKRL